MVAVRTEYLPISGGSPSRISSRVQPGFFWIWRWTAQAKSLDWMAAFMTGAILIYLEVPRPSRMLDTALPAILHRHYLDRFHRNNGTQRTIQPRPPLGISDASPFWSWPPSGGCCCGEALARPPWRHCMPLSIDGFLRGKFRTVLRLSWSMRVGVKRLPNQPDWAFCRCKRFCKTGQAPQPYSRIGKPFLRKRLHSSCTPTVSGGRKSSGREGGPTSAHALRGLASSILWLEGLGFPMIQAGRS